MGFLTGWVPASVLAQPAASDAPYQQDGAKATMKTFTDMRAVRFCEIFFIQIQAEGEQMELNVYNPTGLNDMEATRDSCPDKLLNKVDLEELKTQYKLDAIYLNKPRDWMFDELEVPVGAVRNFHGMDFYWMAASRFPKGMKFEPEFLPYKRAKVERQTETRYKAGKPVFLLDDPDGKVWVMKAFRDSYGQTVREPEGPGRPVQEPPRRLEVPGRHAGAGPDPSSHRRDCHRDAGRFENTFAYMGDGSSNHVP